VPLAGILIGFSIFPYLSIRKAVGALGTRGMSAVYVPRRSPAYFIHMDYFFRGLVTALLAVETIAHNTFSHVQFFVRPDDSPP